MDRRPGGWRLQIPHPLIQGQLGAGMRYHAGGNLVNVGMNAAGIPGLSERFRCVAFRIDVSGPEKRIDLFVEGQNANHDPPNNVLPRDAYIESGVDDLVIGNFDEDADYENFHGLIKDVRIYGVALTDEEIECICATEPVESKDTICSLGACCLEGDCTQTIPQYCGEQGGSFSSAGKGCSLGGCLLGDLCYPTSRDSCLAQGGEFEGC